MDVMRRRPIKAVRRLFGSIMRDPRQRGTIMTFRSVRLTDNDGEFRFAMRRCYELGKVTNVLKNERAALAAYRDGVDAAIAGREEKPAATTLFGLVTAGLIGRQLWSEIVAPVRSIFADGPGARLLVDGACRVEQVGDDILDLLLGQLFRQTEAGHVGACENGLRIY